MTSALQKRLVALETAQVIRDRRRLTPEQLEELRAKICKRLGFLTVADLVELRDRPDICPSLTAVYGRLIAAIEPYLTSARKDHHE